MTTGTNTPPEQPGERTYKVAQMVRAAERGAVQQIERMKKMAAMIEQQRTGQQPKTVNENLTKAE